MSVIPFTRETLLSFIPSQHHQALATIYSRIPTNFVKFLEKRDIVQQINFNRTLQMSDESIGSEYTKQWNSFTNYVYRSIRDVFREQSVTCIDPQELATDISNRYLKEQPLWARVGGWRSSRFEFDQIYKIHDGDIQISRADVHVKAYVREECQDNCFDTNMYLVSYTIELTIKALAVNGHKIRTLCQLVGQNGTTSAIQYINSNCWTLLYLLTNSNTDTFASTFFVVTSVEKQQNIALTQLFLDLRFDWLDFE